MRSRHAPLWVGLLVALLAAALLTVTHHSARPAIPDDHAVRLALRDANTRQALAGSRWNRVTVDRLDSRLEQVTFFAGPQVVAEVALERDGTVLAGVNARRQREPYGDWLAYQPALLVGLCALFVLMTGVTPLRRARNLDVLASTSLVVSVVLFQRRYLAASLLAAMPGMVYLLVRSARRALGPPSEEPVSSPLLTAITSGVESARRVRWLRALLLSLGLVVAMVGLSSPGPVDVIYAVMEGATRLTHGVLPYGHLPPGVIHGDTYPILSYALYAPLALVSPVNTLWDSVDTALAVAVLAALVAAWAVFRTTAGARRSGGRRRPVEAEEAGLRAALACLAFPPLLITVSTGTTDVVLAAVLALAVLLWRRPTACSTLLVAGAWFKLAPVALLPVCVAPLRGRRLVRALAAVVLVSLPPVVLLLALGGLHGPADMLHAMSYQLSRGSLQSIWRVLGIGGLQPLAQACVLGLIAAAVVKLHREPELAHDRARMAALAVAILLGLELAADYWAFLYLVWFMPLVGLSLLAEPNPVTEVAEAGMPAPGSFDPDLAIAT
jgi:Glycosyltransferase family 87